MSQIQNRHWIGFNGEPITGRVPPRLIVYGPYLTGQQRGEVFHVYKLFTDACSVAIGDYHIRNRVLSDGSRVRCTSFMGQDVVEVWTRGVGEEKMLGGFICRPTSGVGDGGAWQYEGPARWWGKPFTPENRPLGTLYGDNPSVTLRPHWKEKKPTSRYRIEKGVDLLYGTVDWQGRNPETDVLSWDAKTLTYERLNISTATFTLAFDQWVQFSEATPPEFLDTTRSAGYVKRMLNRGSGSNIYNNGAVLATISGGNVDGAAFIRVGGKKLLVGAQRTNAFTSTGGQFNFFVFDTDSEEKTIIGSFRPEDTWYNRQGWYFDLDGRKARCVCEFISRYEFPAQQQRLAYEAEITGDTVATLSVSVRTISVPLPPGYNSDWARPLAADFRYNESFTESAPVLLRGDPTARYALVDETGALVVPTVEAYSGGLSLTTGIMVSGVTSDPTTYRIAVTFDKYVTAGVKAQELVDADIRYDALLLIEYHTNEYVGIGQYERVGADSLGLTESGSFDESARRTEVAFVSVGRNGTHIRKVPGAHGIVDLSWRYSNPPEFYASVAYFQDLLATRNPSNTWRTGSDGSFSVYTGVIRTYYGEVLAQTNARLDTDEQLSPASLIGVGDQDAHEILHINEQPYPWLFKIGVF